MKHIFLFVVLLLFVGCAKTGAIVKPQVDKFCLATTDEARELIKMQWNKILFPHEIHIHCNSQLKPSMGEDTGASTMTDDYTAVKSLETLNLDDINVSVKQGADVDLVLAEVISLMATNEVNVIVHYDDLPFVFLHAMSEQRLTQQVQLLRNHLKAKLRKPEKIKTNVVTFASATNKLH